jgi:hypothetical protein
MIIKISGVILSKMDKFCISIYLLLLHGTWNLRTRHAVVTRDPPNMDFYLSVIINCFRKYSVADWRTEFKLLYTLIFQSLDYLLCNNCKQTCSQGNESSRNNRGTVGSCVFYGPLLHRCYATAVHAAICNEFTTYDKVREILKKCYTNVITL